MDTKLNITISTLKKWKEKKEQEGYVPTVELLIEELESND